MFERYSERARRSIFFARYEASLSGSPYIECEHLLLALLREDTTLMLRLLPSSEAAEQLRLRLEQSFVPRPRSSTSVDLPLGNASKRALAYANEETERLAVRTIENHHLLLGLLREEGSLAARMLGENGITLAQVRRDSQQHVASPLPARQPKRAPVPFGFPIPCVKVADIALSTTFYAKLGFHRIAPAESRKLCILRHEQAVLVLYEPSVGDSLKCFTAGDSTVLLERIRRGELHAEQIPSGVSQNPPHLLLLDPDQRPVLLIFDDVADI